MSHHDEKNLDRQGIADKTKAKLNEAAGKAQSQTGKVTGNREQEIGSKAREGSGQGQAKAGEAERNIDRSFDN
jgi:uncharacterized protein YjbJ (UPF0337 family)